MAGPSKPAATLGSQPPAKSSASHRLKVAQWIVSQEARREKAGNIKVYTIPSGDGGGKFEYAGINDRYHPKVLAKIRAESDPKKAEQIAVEYIASYTDIADTWSKIPAINAFLRDCVFNRGAKGAMRILQIALGVKDDGKFGPVTRAALSGTVGNPGALLDDLRDAREKYEYKIAPPVGARAKFIRGLQNRWDACLAFSKTLL